MKKKEIKQTIRSLQDEVAFQLQTVQQLGEQIRVDRNEKVKNLDQALADMFNHPSEFVTVITPSGKIVRALILNTEYEIGPDSLVSAKSVIGFQP